MYTPHTQLCAVVILRCVCSISLDFVTFGTFSYCLRSLLAACCLLVYYRVSRHTFQQAAASDTNSYCYSDFHRYIQTQYTAGELNH